MEIKAFQALVWDYYKKHGRDLPWRHTTDPYCIFISEVMLQQTQVPRVIIKYKEFTEQFPSFQALANATAGDVLKAWQGLGYNRRGLFLHRAAQIIVRDYNGILPNTPEELVKLPGIGPATARSIPAFAFNTPVVFIETNIRRVFIHHFFPRTKNVSDTKLLPLVEQALPQKRARKWYSALMDYGSILPKTVVNPNRQSAHYVRQSAFEGSTRQIRGNILKLLTSKEQMTLLSMQTEIGVDPAILVKVLSGLETEGLIQKRKQYYLLP